MDATLDDILETRDDFAEVRCCGARVGIVNMRPFTPEAAARFSEIQQRVGNAWPEDQEARALVEDPAAHGTPVDGTQIPLSCRTCGASFVWAAGVPRKAIAS